MLNDVIEKVPVLKSITATTVSVTNNLSLIKVDRDNYIMKDSNFEKITIGTSTNALSTGRLLSTKMSVFTTLPSTGGEGLFTFKNVNFKDISNYGLDSVIALDMSPVRDALASVDVINRNRMTITFTTCTF